MRWQRAPPPGNTATLKLNRTPEPSAGSSSTRAAAVIVTRREAAGTPSLPASSRTRQASASAYCAMVNPDSQPSWVHESVCGSGVGIGVGNGVGNGVGYGVGNGVGAGVG
jgi:hypothetical protein